MPGMDGIRAAREITTRHKTAVLVLTAFSQRDLIEGARDAGVAAYLVKPFRRNELLPAIEGVLARCRQEWAIEERDQGDSADVEQAAEDKIVTRQVVDQAKARPHGPVRHERSRGLRLHPAHLDGVPHADARRGPAGGRRHAEPLSR